MFLSLAGLPPLFGFIPKLLALDKLVYHVTILPLFFLILGSLINLFYYLSLSFTLSLPPERKAPTQISSPTNIT